ncbi:DUF416 family protein [Labrys wisconsinensis]|uniref:Uncharacterized protein YjaG (DUF416 family) n=1 Tax=Labrys wisconsinensis TaxID=425677 RepID=A0ABU0JLB2_9HYPH|nr:DUF416 family protein [Labrys wisconsinensis]MDQ0473927.1 uncharacterized protein YjaG (DUF416 family) [Labrys wisconsinensis]
MITFDIKMLERRLSNLSYWDRVAFGVSIVERMMGSYNLFCEKNSLDPSVLQKNLAEIWNFISIKKEDIELSVYIEECDRAAPYPDMYEDDLVSAAMDCAVALASIFRYLEDGEIVYICEVATLSRDSIDMYIQMVERLDSHGSAMELAISQHRLMQCELRNQAEDISFLESLSNDIGNRFEIIYGKFHPQSSNLGL